MQRLATFAFVLLVIAVQSIHAAKPHIVFVIGEQEYETKTTLPAFAAEQLDDYKCTFRFADADDRNQISGLDVIDDADLLVISVRRRAFPANEFAHIRKHAEAGKPILGIRTASHAFDTKGKGPEGHTEWTTFDGEVLGGNYHGHFGNDLKTTVHVVASQAKHPLLKGIPIKDFPSGGSLYKNNPIKPHTTVVLTGSIVGEAPHPVAWTHSYRGGRVFYTSLGHPKDFEVLAFKTLLKNSIRWTLKQTE